MRVVAVVLAGGSGSRSGFTRPKQLVKLAGRPVITYSLERFQTHPGISEIAVVSSQDCVDEVESIVNRERFTKVKKVLLGGKERYQSSLSAIMAYDEDAQKESICLLFHDAVRPLVSQEIITGVIEALRHYKAVDTAIPSTDTVIFTNPETNTIRDIPDRQYVRLGQTPQGFHHSLIKKAYETALLDPSFKTTDDCGVVLKYVPEESIFVVNGSLTNLKLTYEDDLMVIDKFMQSNAGRRVSARSETLTLASLKNKVIVILGGTSGIGASMAQLATAYGAQVLPAGRSTGIDVGDTGSLVGFFESTVRDFGKIDVIINAAAILLRQPLSTMSFTEIDETVRTNILGVMNVARIGHNYLRDTRGHLLLFASSSYTYGRAFYSTYSATKAAVVNFSQALAEEWNDEGIKVNCINPGRARTPMRVKAFGQEPEGSLLEPIDVARRALGILVSENTGLIYDIANK